ncbi:MAG TPA: tetratricopeptide repeat protein [Verrucomicrobiae bacterium]|nr:tetratricopeptide repeat protein [Verrucomicrobiae bacterium]
MKRRELFPLVVIAAGLLTYSNSFIGGFIHDDFMSIPENPTIRHLWPIWRCFSPPHRGGLTVEGRPLINLSLAVNYALGGYEVWGYHVLNLAVHIFAGLTLLGIVRRTLLQPAPMRSGPALRDRFGLVADELALAIAVLWTVHPLQTESVTYIVQRAESIMGLFYLLTLYCFIRGVEAPPMRNGGREMGNGSWGRRSRLWHGASVTTCALGMVSKEVMVTAPVMVMLYDLAFISNSFREAWRRRWRLYLALASTWILLAVVLILAGNFATASTNARHAGFTRSEYLATEPGVVLHYLRMSVWPAPQQMGYGWPTAQGWTSILLPTVVILILLAVSVCAWPRHATWGFVGAWFFLILAPSSSLIPLLNPGYEHRMYLSLAAVVSLAVIGLYSVAGRRSLILFVPVAIGLGVLSWRRNRDYYCNRDSNLAVALEKAGRLQEAISHYERALRVTPGDALGHYNLGIALQKVGRLQEATEQWEQAVRLSPDMVAAYYNLGVVSEQTGKIEDAIRHYERALLFAPDDADVHDRLGMALEKAGRLPEATRHWEEAVRINPGLAEAHNNLGSALLKLGKVPEALVHYEQALRIDPDYAEAHNNLGSALARLGRVPEAISQWERALQINPNYARPHYNLGIALEQAGRPREAMVHYEQALRINPQMTEAQDRLASLRAGLAQRQPAP